MRPGYDAWQPSSIRDRAETRAEAGRPEEERLAALSEEQRRLIAVLQTQRDGMTQRQLQVALSVSQGGVQELLENLQQKRLVARLNTVIPSFVYRYRGVQLDGR